MAEYIFTRKAKGDLLDIIAYTRDHWGRSQTGVYIDSIEKQCLRLADNPDIGKGVEEVSPGLLRYPVESHVIYYQRQGAGIAIIRVLHKRMLPDNHL